LSVRGIPRNASAAADRVDDNILNIIVRRREERKGRRSIRAGRRSVGEEVWEKKCGAVEG
jgi:hypothetical protein